MRFPGCCYNLVKQNDFFLKKSGELGRDLKETISAWHLTNFPHSSGIIELVPSLKCQILIGPLFFEITSVVPLLVIYALKVFL
jgi:hypothetical protein